MNHQQNFTEFKKEIGAFLDNEMAQEVRKSFIQRIEADPNLNKEFAKEKNIREFLKSNVYRPHVSSDLIQSIKDKIRII